MALHFKYRLSRGLGMGKKKVTTITINPAQRSGQKKLEKMLNGGWRIVSESRRSALQWKPGQVDYVLEKDS